MEPDNPTPSSSRSPLRAIHPPNAYSRGCQHGRPPKTDPIRSLNLVPAGFHSVAAVVQELMMQVDVHRTHTGTGARTGKMPATGVQIPVREGAA